MPYPPISALPAVPSRNAPSTFSALMDAFLAAFPQMRTEFNALAAYLDTLALATGPGLFQSGSAALPGIAFAGDTDTGLYRPAANQIGIATAGVQRLLLTTAALRVDLPVTGTAVMESAVDTTAGRLAAVYDNGGIFGWGNLANAPLLANLDATDTPSGVYRTTSDTTGTYPVASGSSAFGVLAVARHNSNAFQQEYADTLTSRRWRRNFRTAGSPQWSPWRLVYDQATVVGTVSQTGGIPDNALIETGTNANGRWIRWADGTQICTHIITTSGSAGVAWTFPAAFSDTAGRRLSAIPLASVLCGPVLDGSPSTIDATFSVRGAGDVRLAVSLLVTAIGRWF